MKIFANKTLWFYLGLLAIPFALVTVITGAAAPGFAHKTFHAAIYVFLGLGIASQIASLFVDFRFWPLISAALYACGLAVVMYCGMPIVMDMINEINFMDGNWDSVVIYIVFTALACAAAAFTAFFAQTKEAKDEKR